MSLSSSLRGHFFKHLASSFRRRTSRPQPSSCFSSFPSAKAAKQSRLNLAIVNYSTHPSINGAAVVADDSLADNPYLCVRIFCSRRVSEVLSESLLCFGASSTTIDEQGSHETDEEEIWISSTFEVDQDVKDCISRAADSIGLKDLPIYKVEMHDHAEWIEQAKESFNPVEIKEGLWIVPEWIAPPDPQAINIILNPGLAFGTGEHPTTKLCLLLLHGLIKGGEYFLDYGTGSGVLAIAALKFGAELSVGFDIERLAIKSARHNAALNSVGTEKMLLSLVSECPVDDISHQDSYNSELVDGKNKYDVVIANILLYPLLDLADRIVSYGKPGATIGISGIISEQVPTVMKRYSELLEDVNVTMMDDWACISGTKKIQPDIS